MLNADKANILKTAPPMYKTGDVWKRRRHGRKTRGQSQNSDAGSSALRGKVWQRITALEKSRSLLVCLKFFHPITIIVCGTESRMQPNVSRRGGRGIKTAKSSKTTKQTCFISQSCLCHNLPRRDHRKFRPKSPKQGGTRDY